MTRWPWLLVIIGCVALFLSLGEWQHIDIATEQPVPAGEPDLMMEQATITQYGEDGSVSYRLLSTEVRHYQDEQITHLTEPSLTLNRAPQPPWFARSDQGYVHDTDTPGGNANEVILLRDDVHLEQREPNKIEITSPSLYVYPDRQYAETDQPVMIDTTAGRSYAIGLSGDLSTGLFKLSSIETQRVHTIVLPGQFKSATTKPTH